MLTFAQFILEVISFVWPVTRVRTGERGVRYWCGKARGITEPGVYWTGWWFPEVKPVPITRDNYETLLQTITTKDGGTLTFNATASFTITDPVLALTAVQRYDETALEDVAAVLADTLADLEVGRLDPEKRRGLLKTCTAAVNAEINAYGVHVERLRFNNFVRNVRGYRLFGELK